MAESAESSKDYFVTTVNEDHATICWGCGLRLLLPTHAPVFKCGWCGAITSQNVNKTETKCLWGRRLQDHRELRWRSKSSAFHRLPFFSCFQYNLHFIHIRVCRVTYLATSKVQIPRALEWFRQRFGNSSIQGSYACFGELSSPTFSQGQNLPQPFKLTG
ncbi:hypothetical protein F383_22200 [Gossypium arboreum]|uniref:Uncharacterized protein n=1 Tax=Gossypium arboreum TaxID=29729 RepID=A0A0B0NZH9_GOSAR|nr:hypothetical protein F383_22200 [Gossypium arboreum]